ncbi:hypothetical protein AAFF_G00039830 [Aldrovandia affinis]|uniref:Uncharacterized protein n=1 Tax=Aldrovandia affinis TaxID=143900 RepID=A0AAD7S3F2_9TELE|nr:hypothetical protein AAFF_G00039830 [Aldrovandia affinis]
MPLLCSNAGARNKSPGATDEPVRAGFRSVCARAFNCRSSALGRGQDAAFNELLKTWNSPPTSPSLDGQTNSPQAD